MFRYEALNDYLRGKKEGLYACERPYDYFVGNRFYGWMVPKDEFVFDLEDFKKCNLLGAHRLWENESLEMLGKVEELRVLAKRVGGRATADRMHELKYKRRGEVDGEEVRFYEYSLRAPKDGGEVKGELFVDDEWARFFKKGFYLKLDPKMGGVYAYRDVGKKGDMPFKLIGLTRVFIRGEERMTMFGKKGV